MWLGAHGIWKWSSAAAGTVVVRNSIFRLDLPSYSACTSQQWPNGTYQDVVLVWAGAGPYASAGGCVNTLPPGVRLTTDVGEWDRAKAAWLAGRPWDANAAHGAATRHDAAAGRADRHPALRPARSRTACRAGSPPSPVAGWSGRAVLLQRRPAGATRWTTASRVTSDSTGRVRRTVRPDRVTWYRWSYRGEHRYAPTREPGRSGCFPSQRALKSGRRSETKHSRWPDPSPARTLGDTTCATPSGHHLRRTVAATALTAAVLAPLTAAPASADETTCDAVVATAAVTSAEQAVSDARAAFKAANRPLGRLVAAKRHEARAELAQSKAALRALAKESRSASPATASRRSVPRPGPRGATSPRPGACSPSSGRRWPRSRPTEPPPGPASPPPRLSSPRPGPRRATCGSDAS